MAFHGRLPWMQGVITLRPFEEDRWELYRLADDPTESHDLAAAYPDKLRDMQRLFATEAAKHQVYPLDDTSLAKRASALQSGITKGVTTFSYDGNQTRIPESLAPWPKRRSHTITADVSPPPKAEGVIVAQGGRFGGYALYVKDGKLNYAYNFVGETITVLQSTGNLPEGHATLRFEFKRAPVAGNDTRGIASLFINDEKAGEAVIERTNSGLFGFLDTFDIGSDTITSVVPEVYASPFAFTGRINKVAFNLQDDGGDISLGEEVLD